MKTISIKTGLFATLLFFCAPLTQAQTILKLNNTQISEMGISVAFPKPVTSVLSRDYPAKITIPNAQIRALTPMLPGIINILYVAEGDQITKGQKLAEISSPAFLETQQNYLDALSRQAVMSKNQTRNTELLNEGIVSEKTFMTAQSELQAAEAFLSRSHQSLIFAGMTDQQIAALKKSRSIYRTMIIYSPFDGSVLQQTVTTGEHVDETTSIYHIGQLNPLWVEIHVPYILRASIQIGNIINIDGTNGEGKVITIGQMVHEEDQGILVRGLLNVDQNQYIPGQYVNVSIEQKIGQGSFYQIPAGSIIRDGKYATLFIREIDGFSLKRTTIIADEGMAVIVSGDISPADQIAIAGIVTLKGMLEGLGSEE